MNKRDILAFVLVILCLVLLGSSYFLTNVTENFINIFFWIKVITIILTIGYLYFAYMQKK